MLYYLLSIIIRLVSYIPFCGLYVLSDLLFYPVYYIFRYRRKIVRKNLTETFPTKGQDEIKKIEQGFYHFLIDTVLETSKLASLSPEEMKSRVRFTNIELVNDVLSRGKSIAVFIGHYGNWEWLSSVGLWLCKESACIQIYHKLSNESVDKLMINLRERSGSVCVEMHNTARFVANASANRESYVYGLIADQSPRKRDAKHYVDFLNHNVPVLVGPEKLVRKYGLEAAFLGVRRIRRGYYECELSVLSEDIPSTPEYALSDLYMQRLEKEILRQPELYLWSHKRFRLAR